MINYIIDDNKIERHLTYLSVEIRIILEISQGIISANCEEERIIFLSNPIIPTNKAEIFHKNISLSYENQIHAILIISKYHIYIFG